MQTQTPTPTLGRIVLYCLTLDDEIKVGRRREVHTMEAHGISPGCNVANTIGQRLRDGMWPEGAQAHVGNPVCEGQVFPASIVAVWGESPDSAVNLQVLLDGNDVLWVKSTTVNRATDGKPTPGQFDWPQREAPKSEAAKMTPAQAINAAVAGDTVVINPAGDANVMKERPTVMPTSEANTPPATPNARSRSTR